MFVGSCTLPCLKAGILCGRPLHGQLLTESFKEMDPARLLHHDTNNHARTVTMNGVDFDSLRLPGIPQVTPPPIMGRSCR
eukprot:7227762-Pyramimonas_sp.AAC.1